MLFPSLIQTLPQRARTAGFDTAWPARPSVAGSAVEQLADASKPGGCLAPGPDDSQTPQPTGENRRTLRWPMRLRADDHKVCRNARHQTNNCVKSLKHCHTSFSRPTSCKAFSAPPDSAAAFHSTALSRGEHEQFPVTPTAGRGEFQIAAGHATGDRLAN